MIGIIITGHSEFARGMTKSLTMIAGAQENYQAIDFESNQHIDEYKEKMTESVQSLLGKTDGVMIFTDLLNGLPYRTAVDLADKHENVEILTGTNLSMLIETSVLRESASDVHGLAAHAASVGRDGVKQIQNGKSNKTNIR